MTKQITRDDVAQAAASKGVTIMEAIRMMQAVCAKAGDEKTLSALCAVKNEILFGDE
jgi:hypothetical protein